MRTHKILNQCFHWFRREKGEEHNEEEEEASTKWKEDMKIKKRWL